METETKQQKHLKPFSKDFSTYGQILSIEMSPYVLTQDLMLIGFEKKILLTHLKIDVS